mmetsp:Transcript_67918/g.110151  ORF Transcript_67918/g.110151 Transcript_67918/m.110151 type:complete len:125 (+) Transcript_67918:49-423(+)
MTVLPSVLAKRRPRIPTAHKNLRNCLAIYREMPSVSSDCQTARLSECQTGVEASARVHMENSMIKRGSARTTETFDTRILVPRRLSRSARMCTPCESDSTLLPSSYASNEMPPAASTYGWKKFI